MLGPASVGIEMKRAYHQPTIRTLDPQNPVTRLLVVWFVANGAIDEWDLGMLLSAYEYAEGNAVS